MEKKIKMQKKAKKFFQIAKIKMQKKAKMQKKDAKKKQKCKKKDAKKACGVHVVKNKILFSEIDKFQKISKDPNLFKYLVLFDLKMQYQSNLF